MKVPYRQKNVIWMLQIKTSHLGEAMYLTATLKE